MPSKILSIDNERIGQRIDNFLVLQLKGVPHSRIYRALRKGEVRVNKKRVVPSYRLQQNDLVRIPPIRVSEKRIIPKPSSQFSALLKKSVIFENKKFLVINKPSGLSVHGGSDVTLGLIEACRAIQSDWKSLQLAHRLDRDTSGCLLLAKDRAVLLELQKLFRERRIEKTYLLLVKGHFSKARHLKTKLEKTNRGGERMISVSDLGKLSETIFEPIAYSEQFTLLRATLLTGRMHQIRVHAMHMDHSIIGDTKYGDKIVNQAVLKQCKNKRLFLHAETLSFTWHHEFFSFKAPLDKDFLSGLYTLGIEYADSLRVQLPNLVK